MTIYYWLTFALSFWILLRLPTKLGPIDNVGGSFVCALFGFALWPLYLTAWWRTRSTGGEHGPV